MASVAGSLTPLREPAAIFLCRFLLSLEGRPQWRAPTVARCTNRSL